MSYSFDLEEHLWEKHYDVCSSCIYQPKYSIDPQWQDECKYFGRECEWVEVEENSGEYMPSMYDDGSL